MRTLQPRKIDPNLAKELRYIADTLPEYSPDGFSDSEVCDVEFARVHLLRMIGEVAEETPVWEDDNPPF